MGMVHQHVCFIAVFTTPVSTPGMYVSAWAIFAAHGALSQ